MKERFVERFPLAVVHPIVAYAVTLGLCGAALGLRLLAEPVLQAGYPYVTFFPAVVLSAFLFGRGPAILAGALCWMFAWYFFIAPQTGHVFTLGTFVALAFYFIVVAVDIILIDWMQQSNKRLADERARGAALAEHREMLFRELQHRVSNNLQVAAALIALQRRNIDHPGARKALDEASHRLALIGKISRALYDPSGQRLSVRSFVETLAKDVLDANGRTDVRVDLVIDDDVAIDPDAAIPFALIMAEAVANALEHGFADRVGGLIRVTVRGDAGLELDIVDDGCGLPENFDLQNSQSLGLRIATALAQQLGGTFRLLPGDSGGVRASLMVPAAA
ncbi:histidine kinase [Sphingobium sp. SCG-1]|uniref:sensor histidine kinase n=1 Tax=Sphingobium sp. SCG-1 TaxID=2072936 RepID=UPI000CD69380|nr:histidine kinase dimerization/phosphoacceptor domain -containing protein [Sphingobium sp. SCG-1]AUW57616.1 histidine kinase [Sphingobium sp. SCG-1]